MNPEVKSRWLAWTAPFEGRYGIIYADKDGGATTGEGNLLPDVASALRLPWKRKVDNSLAARDQVTAEWNRVHGNMRLAKAGAEEAKRESTIYISSADIDLLVLDRLTANDAIFARHIPTWSAWPWQAQMVRHSIGWAEGPSSPYPKFEAAVARRDWMTAIKECEIPGEATNRGLIPRNKADRELLLSLASGQQAPLPSAPPALPPAAAPSPTHGRWDWLEAFVAWLLRKKPQ